MRASGGKSASWGPKRTDQILVAMYQLDHDSTHLFSIRLNSIFKFSASEPHPWMSARLTITTISSLRCLMLWRRNASLMILFTRLLSAAPEIVFFPTIIPSLAFFLVLRAKKILKCLSDMFSAPTTWLKPFSRNNRCAAVNLADRLNCESCTSLGAACLDYCAASACLHSHQKAVGTFSFGYGWLICTFHVLFLGKP